MLLKSINIFTHHHLMFCSMLLMLTLRVSILLALHNSHILLEVTLIGTNDRKIYLFYVLKIFSTCKCFIWTSSLIRKFYYNHFAYGMQRYLFKTQNKSLGAMNNYEEEKIFLKFKSWLSTSSKKVVYIYMCTNTKPSTLITKYYFKIRVSEILH